ncbi:M16 family metallopeptidase [Paenibacillus silagei]|uniref:Zn-dependent peptidase n=1 Tax=Paenibacillus silagei TaxID=1670801 RepID=A0ABS4NK63_9BACL|nr:pitrilysin family protein [Paenibacillus silagei]MBP2110419.1 putative Zn-dependent peptidase [Paenibacillus silagei]
MDQGGATCRRLSSGLKIIHLPLAGLNTVSIGLLSGAGARLEAEDEIGSSRILEDWIWRREQKQEDIHDILADFGANLKTSSNIEWTRHWTTVLCNQFEPVFKLFLHDILEFDLCTNTFAASKEYTVTLASKRRQEPNAYVMDVLREKMSGGTTIGRSTVGLVEDMDKLDLPKIQNVYERLYAPNNCVVAVVGGIPKDRMGKLLDEIVEAGDVQNSPVVPQEESPSWQSCVHSIEQEGRLVHLGAALPCVSCSHPDFFAFAVLSQALGGGDGSRLFESIRQKKGLAYQVRSSLMSFRDTGLLTFYLATGPNFVSWAASAIAGEIKHIRNKGISREEVNAAKNQLLNQMVLRSESTASRMNTLLTASWYPGYPGTLTAMEEAISAVTPKAIQSALMNVAPAAAMGLVTLGPVSASALVLDQ